MATRRKPVTPVSPAKPKVFVSWSGAASEAAAKALKKAIEAVFNNVEAWVSSEDIKLGEEWFGKLTEALAGSKFAIVCLTRRNLASGWVMFETGAVAGTFRDKAKVVPVLLEGDTNDLVDPLKRFNGTAFTEDGMRRLFESINQHVDAPLTDEAVRDLLRKQWKALKKAVDSALRAEPKYDVFLSVPMAAFASDAQYQAFRTDALKVVAGLRERCKLRVYCALEKIGTTKKFETGGAAAQQDLAALADSANLVMIYPERLATSALFEAGFALARGLPCRLFVRDQSRDEFRLPYLMGKLPEAYSNVSIVDASEWQSFDDITERLVENQAAWFGRRLAALPK